MPLLVRGAALCISGHSLNGRGDFFHETHQLYDPEAAELFDPRNPKARSRQPLAGSSETFVPTWVSPSGELALSHDVLVRFGEGIVASGFDRVCGFWGGGWEVLPASSG